MTLTDERFTSKMGSTPCRPTLSLTDFVNTMSTCCLKNSFRHCSWHRLRPGWRPADDDDDDNEGDDADGA